MDATVEGFLATIRKHVEAGNMYVAEAVVRGPLKGAMGRAGSTEELKAEVAEMFGATPEAITWFEGRRRLSGPRPARDEGPALGDRAGPARPAREVRGVEIAREPGEHQRTLRWLHHDGEEHD